MQLCFRSFRLQLGTKPSLKESDHIFGTSLWAWVPKNLSCHSLKAAAEMIKHVRFILMQVPSHMMEFV